MKLQPICEGVVEDLSIRSSLNQDCESFSHLLLTRDLDQFSESHIYAAIVCLSSKGWLAQVINVKKEEPFITTAWRTCTIKQFSEDTLWQSAFCLIKIIHITSSLSRRS